MKMLLRGAWSRETEHRSSIAPPCTKRGKSAELPMPMQPTLTAVWLLFKPVSDAPVRVPDIDVTFGNIFPAWGGKKHAEIRVQYQVIIISV